MDNSPPTGRTFVKYDILSIFRNSLGKIQVSLLSGVTGTIHDGLCRPTFMIYLTDFFLELETLQTEVV